MLKINDIECTGCQMCASVCSVDAITYVERNGFLYPKVDANICINCDMCARKCPSLNDELNSNSYIATYAAWSKDYEKRIRCTSGGVCYELSKAIIKCGGYVAGVEWDENYKDAKYVLINDYNGLERITQTKYFQPQILGIYDQVKNLIEKGIMVLFIGTACTNAALRQYLGKEYENLYCCDFICRGYTSQLYHKKRVIDLENKNSSKISNVQYKNKSKGWKNFGTLFEFVNGKRLFISRHEDPYENMFKLNDYNTRPSCFNCKYRNIPRLADITVGDFWGIQGIEKEEEFKGISAVMIFSNKGKALFELIKSDVYFEERSLYEVMDGNFALVNQLKQNDGAELFFEELKEHSIDYINQKYAIRKNKNNMKKKFFLRFKEISKCDLLMFVYYNFLCKSVQRKKGKYIVPYKGTCIDLKKSGKILVNENIYLNALKPKGSKEQLFLTIYEGGVLEINGKALIASKSTIQILSDAQLTLGRMDTNANLTIICSNKIDMGNGVRIGRNVMIYDSSYHITGINKGKKQKPLIIGNHVWLCSGVVIAKGIKIGDGAICGLNSLITRNVKSRFLVMGNPAKDIMPNVEWS